MIQQIFTVYDNKAKAFLKPFFTRNTETALRMIKETIYTSQDHEFSRYSSDYELYQLGEYDDDKGTIASYTPAHVINFNQLKFEESPKAGGASEAELNAFDQDAEKIIKAAANN